jgi:hypothetical protein
MGNSMYSNVVSSRKKKRQYSVVRPVQAPTTTGPNTVIKPDPIEESKKGRKHGERFSRVLNWVNLIVAIITAMGLVVAMLSLRTTVDGFNVAKADYEAARYEWVQSGAVFEIVMVGEVQACISGKSGNVATVGSINKYLLSNTGRLGAEILAINVLPSDKYPGVEGTAYWDLNSDEPDILGAGGVIPLIIQYKRTDEFGGDSKLGFENPPNMEIVLSTGKTMYPSYGSASPRGVSALEESWGTEFDKLQVDCPNG